MKSSQQLEEKKVKFFLCLDNEHDMSPQKHKAQEVDFRSRKRREETRQE